MGLEKIVQGLPVLKIQIPISEGNRIIINKLINGELPSDKETSIDEHFKLSWIEQQRSGTFSANIYEMSRRNSTDAGLDYSNDRTA